MPELRQGESVLNFPEQDPPPRSYPELDRLGVKSREFWAVLDPPRTKILGGKFELAAKGDGWRDRNTENFESAEQAYERARDEALERIAIYEKDPTSSKARIAAMMAAEVCVAAHERMVKFSEPEAPGDALLLRPDSYTIVRAGDGVPFVAGDRVILAPYAPRRQQNLFGVDDVCLVGFDDPWEDITPFVQNRYTKSWELTCNWLAIALYKKVSPLAQVKPRWVNAGRILMAGPTAESLPEDDVVLHRDRTLPRPDNQRWFISKFGPFPRGVVFTREVDSGGNRRVLAYLRTEQVDISA